MYKTTCAQWVVFNCYSSVFQFLLITIPVKINQLEGTRQINDCRQKKKHKAAVSVILFY